MRNISDISFEDNQNAFYIRYFVVENRAVYEITWKNEVEPDRPYMIVWLMRISCWLAKVKTHTQNM